MSISKEKLRPYLSEFRELVEDSEWSTAVRKSREADIQGNVQGDAIFISLRFSHEKKATKLEFSLSEYNYISDCSCQDDPCVHLLAGVILLNTKWEALTDDSSEGVPSGKIPWFEYHIHFPQSKELSVEQILLEPKLSIIRYLCREDSSEDSRDDTKNVVKKEFVEPLVEYAGGISSGRIKADMPMLGTDDYVIDRALGQKKKGEVLSDYYNETMLALSRISQVYFENRKVKINPESESYELISEINSDGVTLKPLTLSMPFLYEEAGVVHWRILLKKEFRQSVYQGMNIPFRDLSVFLEEKLPILMKSCRVIAPKEGWPEVVLSEPEIIFETEALDSGYVIKPFIEYGKPPLARIGKDGSIALLNKKSIPRRDFNKEVMLSRAIIREMKLKVGDPKVVVDGQAVLYAELLANKTVRGGVHKAYEPGGTLSPLIHNENDSIEVVFTIPDVHMQKGDSTVETVSFDEVMQAYQSGKTAVKIPSGAWLKLPKKWLDEISPMLGSSISESSSSKARTALQLAPFIGDRGVNFIRDFFEMLENTKRSASNIITPEGIVLRAYQEEGVRWIQRLSSLGEMGALLADDMGLGKTIQTLASLKIPALVIVPTSLLPQWEEELSMWFPQSSLSVYHGSNRNWDENSDIVLSTYGILRNESEIFSSRTFEMIVLDEIQTIKNPLSAVSEAAFNLKGRFKLGLSGTPLENSALDLWSICNFLIPGILPEPDKLQKFLETEQGLILIRKMLSSFILRRKKTEVLEELPEKTEISVRCVMEDAQRKLYEEILNQARDEAKTYFDKRTNYVSLFEKLLRLRQACVHPGLIDGLVSSNSVKITTILDYLERIVATGHKVLVFSQWTSALDILEPQVEALGMSPLRIDGKTRNRKEVLHSFKTEVERSVLLLSLKAGGVGLNLTEADHVIFLDPWWNPAVEKQAEDRVYRIGQDNPVFVYRMLVKDSIEEKILELHKRKSALSEALLDGSSGSASSFTDDDVRFLLSL